MTDQEAQQDDVQEEVVVSIPLAQVKLLRRLAALPDSRYAIMITKDNGNLTDWTVMPIGKVERPA